MYIETTRLIMRPLHICDAERYFEMTRDEEVRKYVPFACPKDLEESRYDINHYYSKCDFNHDYYFAIELKSTNKIIGAIIVTQSPGSSKFDTCYFIDRNYRNQGYAFEALRAVSLAMPRQSILSFEIEDTNIASLKVVSKFTKTEKYDNLKGKNNVFNFEYRV